MGTSVYVGITDDGSEVAVKKMLLGQAGEEGAGIEDTIMRLCQEQKSPFIVSYHSHFQVDDFTYLILDLCEETLKNYVSFQTLDHLRKHSQRMTKEILTALHFLHSNGIFHRDLKPTNILVDVQGHLRLADFGINHVFNESEGAVSSDPNEWMPAEKIQAIHSRQQFHFETKSDVQVLGMLVFYILTKGEHPFGVPSDIVTNILRGDAVNLDKLENPEARQFVAWLISHKIDDRPYAHEALRHSLVDQVEL